MKSDYSSWYLQNEDLFEILFKNDSIIFNQFNDIIKVLDYINKMDNKDLTDDFKVFKDTGFAYLFNKTEELKHYINHYFNNKLSDFLKYEVLINFAFYLDDLKGTLQEEDLFNIEVETGFNEILEDIENIVRNKKRYSGEVLNSFNTILLSVVPANKELLTIPEIFGRVAEELQL